MRWALGLLVVAACTSATELPVPPDDGASAVVTFFLAGDDVIAAFAADADPTFVPPSFSGEAGVTALVLFELACPLAALGVAPGEQALEDVAVEPPAHLSAYRMVLEDAMWTRAVDVDGLLGRLPFAFDPRCPVLTRVRVGEPIAYGIGLADGAVLVAGETDLLRVDIEGTVEPVGARPAGTFAATRTGDTVWLVADDAVWRGDPVDGFERIALSNGENGGRGWVDASRDDGPVEILLVSRFGVGLVYREGADSWDRRPFFDNAVSPWVNPSVGLPYAGALWLGPGEMLAAGGERLAHASGGRPKPQPCPERTEYTGMVQLPSGEILVSAVEGQISQVNIDQDRAVCGAVPATATVGPTIDRLFSFDARPTLDIGVFDDALLALLPGALAVRREETLTCPPERVIGERVIERTIGGAAVRESQAVVFVRKVACAP